MKKLLMCFAFIGMSFGAFAQQNFIKHKVESGETVTKIAQKYEITPANIFKLNPDAQNGLQPDMILLIPKGQGIIIRESEAKVTDKKTHLVSPKETIYGLTKLYNITEADLLKANPGLAESGLKIGDELIIPSKQAIVTPLKSVATTPKNTKVHVVEAKETKYSISKQYNVSIEELEKLNPEIKDGLQIGYSLKIPKEITEKADKVEVKPNAAIIAVPIKPNMVSYEVQPKETLYGISKKTGYSQEELMALNPSLKEGVRDGMVLYFPNPSAKTPLIAPKKQGDLTQTFNTSTRKKLVLLMPFNISKIQSDTSSVRNRIRNDKFLSMTLDFYSGALMAIDSAKVLGLNVDVKIFDSQETKNSSNVASIFNQSNFNGTNVVIGPFYQSNVESAAQLLVNDSISIVSPLSKETTAVLPNVIQTIPSDLFMKDKMFEFMKMDGNNVFGVIDTKKLSTRKYFVENQKDVKMVNFESIESTNNGIKLLLEKGKRNYVVMDTENTYRIKMIISTLLALQSEYDIQLVVLETNSKLDSDEIKMESLAKLKLMYPSLGKQVTENEKSYFTQKYRKINMIAPNPYAVRGFDVTFDALLRLSQEKEFKETLLSVATEQFENKFAYAKRADKGFRNTGFYILYYDTDLSIKTAN
ncbi:LysM peptidoglycan-binding domain-containing protein [Flavobacterium antarcticum]|uniref:LysM peptidoglycan-binding domain-containing protein n=1 Tax=Flavobacterium antarcticum TaxID=271155 RepID=UPI0003B5AD33|nr:LysM peptidoglycan-binding domain-containing protein [Flavobacterium antarcticum]